MYEICSKLTLKTLKRYFGCCSSFFATNLNRYLMNEKPLDISKSTVKVLHYCVELQSYHSGLFLRLWTNVIQYCKHLLFSEKRLCGISKQPTFSSTCAKWVKSHPSNVLLGQGRSFISCWYLVSCFSSSSSA